MPDTSAATVVRKTHTFGRCRCAQCGYTICDGEPTCLVIATGDTIHRACWEEYAGDNADDFLDDMTL